MRFAVTNANGREENNRSEHSDLEHFAIAVISCRPRIAMMQTANFRDRYDLTVVVHRFLRFVRSGIT